MKRTIPALAAAFLLITGCGLARSEAPTAFDEMPAQPLGLDMPAIGAPEPLLFAPTPMATTLGDRGLANAPSPGGGQAASVERLVVQNAELAVVVPDVEARMQQISEMAEKMGGYVVSSNLRQRLTRNGVEVPEVQMVIRVRAERLEEALDLIKSNVVDVQSETRSGTDVTAQYVDLESRLKNLEAAEAKLDEIMKQASETEDVVNVFNQLVYYREQIELVKGQMNYYEEAAALSAITVRLIAEETVQPIEIGPWQPQGVALEAIQDLVDFSKGFVEFLIRFVLYTLPVLVMIGIPFYLVFLGARAVYRRMRRTAPKAIQPFPEAEGARKKKQ